MKRLVAAMALGALIATGAFAQLMFGITGVQYYQEDSEGNLPTVGEAWKQFQDGEGVYMGGFAEIAFSKLGFGFSFNYDEALSTEVGYWDPFTEMYSYVQNTAYDQWSYDVNFYLSYHLFKARSFLDPMLDIGIGMTAFDYMNKDATSLAINGADEDDPLMASMYWDLGAGLGVNLGPVGVFVKARFNSLFEDVLKGNDDVTGDEYPIAPFPAMPFKWIFGAKVIL